MELKIFRVSWVTMCFISYSAFSQSGWTRQKKTYFVKTSINLFNSSAYYNLDGEKLTTTEFRQQSLSLYGEYGITDRLTGIINFPMLKLNSYANTDVAVGIGDLKLEVKYALLRKNIPLSISVAPEFPTGSKNNYAQNTTSADQINLPTGDGEFNVWTTLAASHSFYPVPAYVSVSTAYNYRTQYNGFSFRDQLKSNLEVGYKLLDVVWFNATLSAQTSIGVKPVGTTEFIRGEGTEFTALGLGASYQFIKGWSVALQGWGYSDLLFARKNIYSAPTYSIGVFYELK